MKYTKEPHYFLEQPEYAIMYQRLLKESRVWNSMGQYWLSKECYNRATQLLNGDTECCKKPLNTEDLLYKTKRL